MLAGAPLAAQQSSPAAPNANTAGPIPAVLPAQNIVSSPKASASQRAVPVPSTANAPEVNNGALRPVQGELESKLDSTVAKPGDPVVVKTTEKAATADGVVIPSGSKIVGKVVDAQPAAGATKPAKVTVEFDRAQLANGRSLPIKTVLQSVAPAESSAAAAPVGGEASSTKSSEAGAATRTDAAATSAPATASAGANPSEVGTVVAKQGDVAIKTTAIPGVLIAANADGRPFSNASGALLSPRQNVRLDGGTHIVLAVSDAGTKRDNHQ
jgi:hypothetical protein